MVDSAHETLLRELIEIVSREAMVDATKLTPETELNALDIQSADYVMILMAVEEKFGVYISIDSDFTDAKTVGDLASVVAQKIKEGAKAS
jgi:acyl carrier protein